MNEQPIPPQLNPSPRFPSYNPPKLEFEAMPQGVGVVSIMDALLKKPGRLVYEVNHDNKLIANLSLFVITLGCFLAYGLIVGLFSGGTQLWASPLKIAAGALMSGLICLPSLYIFSCLCGADSDLRGVTGLLLGALALMSVLMIGFAPVAWVFTVSTQSIGFMGFLHLVFWFIAAAFGLRLLSQGFHYFPCHRGGFLWLWMIIFMFVSVQMTTTLRPLIDTADTLLPSERKFFLQHCVNGPDERRQEVRKKAPYLEVFK